MQVQADLAKVGGRSGVMSVPNAWQGLQYFETGHGARDITGLAVVSTNKKTEFSASVSARSHWRL